MGIHWIRIEYQQILVCLINYYWMMWMPSRNIHLIFLQASWAIIIIIASMDHSHVTWTKLSIVVPANRRALSSSSHHSGLS
jgi:hypothetical protein